MKLDETDITIAKNTIQLLINEISEKRKVIKKLEMDIINTKRQIKIYSEWIKLQED